MLENQNTEFAETGAEVQTALMRAHPINPALQRLQSRVLANAKASDVITSYDRMHHRHSRS